MGNTAKINFGSVIESTEAINAIPEAKTLRDIWFLCEKALEQNKECFEFCFQNKKYSASVDRTYLISEMVGDKIMDDIVGHVFVDDPIGYSNLNGVHF